MNPPPPQSGADQPPLDQLLSLSDAAERRGLSASHLGLLVRTGQLWGVKLGASWYTTEAAVRDYQAQDHKPGPKRRTDL